MRGTLVGMMVLLLASPAWAQDDAIPVSDALVEANTTDIDTVQLPNISQTESGISQTESNIEQIEENNIEPGLAGGFDYSQTLTGDLEQQVDSAGGMPLTQTALAKFTTAWPGYSIASYEQVNAGSSPVGSPEGNAAITLGTLQGALNASADRQQSQAAENTRLSALADKNQQASGNLQVQEVGNEIGLFNGQETIKLGNAIEAQNNALLVTASNRVNQEALDRLEALGVMTEKAQWDATNTPPGADPQIPTAPALKWTQ